MGLLARFVNAWRASDDDDRSPFGNWWFRALGARVSAGIRVTPETAMRLTAVFACVRLISETFATLPFQLYRNEKLLKNHWIVPLFTKRPNKFQTAFEWREMLQGHLALRGNCYNRIIGNGRGEITDLCPLHPDRVKIELLNPEGTDYRYLITDRTGKTTPAQRGDIWHVRGLSSDGIIGLSPLALARESIGVGLAAQDYGARFFANDTSPQRGWIEHPGSFKDKAAKDAFKEAITRSQGGANKGRPYILEHGMKYHEVGVANNDAQFLESRKFQVTDIARAFRVPPHMIGDLERATFSNVEQMSLEFVKYCLTPWAERWEASIETELLLDDIDDGLEIEFDMDRLLRGDSTTRFNNYQSAINTGWMTRNEARLAEGRQPIAGLDEPLRPLNEIPNNQEPAAPMKDGDPVPPTKPAPPAIPVNKRESLPAPGKKAPAAPPPALPPPKKTERQLVLEAAAMERITRKEASALARHVDPQLVFDDKHARFVAEVLAVDVRIAQSYCEYRLRGAGPEMLQAALVAADETHEEVMDRCRPKYSNGAPFIGFPGGVVP
jgi:HK97 family phage portal protein